MQPRPIAETEYPSCRLSFVMINSLHDRYTTRPDRHGAVVVVFAARFFLGRGSKRPLFFGPLFVPGRPRRVAGPDRPGALRLVLIRFSASRRFPRSSFSGLLRLTVLVAMHLRYRDCRDSYRLRAICETGVDEAVIHKHAIFVKSRSGTSFAKRTAKVASKEMGRGEAARCQPTVGRKPSGKCKSGHGDQGDSSIGVSRRTASPRSITRALEQCDPGRPIVTRPRPVGDKPSRCKSDMTSVTADAARRAPSRASPADWKAVRLHAIVRRNNQRQQRSSAECRRCTRSPA